MMTDPDLPLPTASLDYKLDNKLIAAYPTDQRDASRLLVWSPTRTPSINDCGFAQIIDHFGSNDLLVLNRTAVNPCRTKGRTDTGSEREFLWLRPQQDAWLCFGQTRRLKTGALLDFGHWKAQVLEIHDEYALLKPDRDIAPLLQAHAGLALPPYIVRKRGAGHEVWQDDPLRYQTVFADRPGAVAAPTASLHWTPALLAQVAQQGTQIVYITLHVGPGTFKPVRVDDLRRHRVDPEYAEIDGEAARLIGKALREGRRITAGGTTTVRALEGVYGQKGFDAAGWRGEVDLTIVPGFTFNVIDRLITNFHIPGSSLLALVDAFTQGAWKSIYQHAMHHHYRFYSYGDASLLYRSDIA